MINRRPRYTIGSTARLASQVQTPLGTLPAGTTGEIQDLTTDRARLRITTNAIWIDPITDRAGLRDVTDDVWIDLDQLQPERISLDESGATK